MGFAAYDMMFYPPLKNVYRSIAELASKHCSNVIDIGSGTGTVCKLMKERGIKASGIDMQWKMIKNALEKDGEISYFLGSGYNLPFKNESFDCSTMSFLLHGVDEYMKIIEEAKRVVRKGGRIIITDYASSKNFASFVIRVIETFAKEEHKRNYFNFMKEGGIETVIKNLKVDIEEEKNYFRGAIKSYVLSL